MPESNWIQELKDLLCRLYREWGGDCNQLPFPVTDQIAEQWDRYKAQGAPSFPTQPQQAAYLQLLTDIESHLDLAGNTLSPADDSSLRNLTAQLRSDLGGG